MKEFVHLHLHTQYSLLDGAIRLEPLFKTAHAYNMDACAITDHGNMFGAIDFFFTARAAGIKPVIGCEVYVAPKSRFEKGARGEDNAFHLILLAMNNVGYHNLLRIVSAAHLESFYYVPRIDKDLLKSCGEGLICLTSCMKGQIPTLILRDDEKGARAVLEEYSELFKDRFYLELQDNGMEEQKKINEGLLRFSRHYDLPLVATNDCHYLRKEEARAHELLLCIQTGKTIADKGRLRLSTDEFYFKSPEEMIRAFSHYPDAVANTVKIADMCDITIDEDYHFPRFHLPEGKSLNEYLQELCLRGFEKKLPRIAASYPAFDEELKQKYRSRLEYELDVIKNTGFAGYFLIVSDFISFAKSKEIPVGPGRGSAAGSLVAYCLDITNIDSIKYDLIFERFLNPERISMPDIDVDFCINGREQVIEYVTEKYGKENVAQIITFGTMKSRAAVRDVGRALGVPYSEVDRIAKLIPPALDMTIEQAMVDEPRLKEVYDQDPRVSELLDNARVLERLARHASTHAAGIVISNKPLVEYVPLYRGQKGETVTQYHMKSIEKIGLVKFDLLGLKTLTVIDRVLKTLRSQGVTLELNELRVDDPETYRLLSAGQTSGVFQLESRGMKELLARLKPSQFQDIIALIALYRPGPLTSGMMEEFIRRKNNPSLIKYETALLEEVLKDTYGVIVYQEQVMKIATRLGNFTQSEADALRKAMSKKIPEQLESYKEQFKTGCVANSVPGDVASKIYDIILRFGQYGFNKSHSAAYALVAYQTAYLKTHHYVPFMAAILTNEVGDTDGLIHYVTECRENGVDILPPDINHSDKAFTVAGDAIRFGLSGIKNVGDAALDSIVKVREEVGEFTSFTQFCSLADSRKVNRKVLESLVKAGCFDGMGMKRPYLLGLVRDKLDRIQKKEKANGYQMDIFGSGQATGEEEKTLWAEELPHDEVLKGEKEALGFFFSEHPLKAHEKIIGEITPHTTSSIKEMDITEDVSVVGIVNGYKELTTKKGDRMASIGLEDTRGIVEAIIFPDLFSKHLADLKSEKPLVITGSVEKTEDGTTKIRAKAIVLLEEIVVERERVVRIRVNCKLFRKDDLRRLREVLLSIRGPSKVVLELQMNGERQSLEPQELRIDAARIELIRKHFAEGLEVEVSG